MQDFDTVFNRQIQDHELGIAANECDAETAQTRLRGSHPCARQREGFETFESTLYVPPHLVRCCRVGHTDSGEEVSNLRYRLRSQDDAHCFGLRAAIRSSTSRRRFSQNSGVTGMAGPLFREEVSISSNSASV